MIIVGGIYAGVFSPTEAASVCVAYALFIELVVYRSLTIRDLPDIAQSVSQITAIVFILVAFGSAFSWTVSFARLPQDLVMWAGLESMSDTKFLIAMSIAFFVGCMFVDPIVVVLILVSVFDPMVDSRGIDPVLVGTIIVLQIAIGSATPPFGVDIFTAVAVFRRPYIEVIRGTPPFFVMLLFVAVLLIFWPPLALGLRDLAF